MSRIATSVECGPSGDGGQSSTGVLTQEVVRALAIEAGFAEAGVVALPHAEERRDAARFEEWVEAGRAGTMKYLERVKAGPEQTDSGQARPNQTGSNQSEPNKNEGKLVRARVGIPFPWARSAVVCFAGYHSAETRSIDPAGAGAGWIARYAWTSRVEPGRTDANGVRRPSDYHKVLLKRLRALEAKLRDQCGEFESRAYVDTGPVAERPLATAAGLGWTGKNTCLIHPKLGSYGFLAVLITSLEVQKEEAPLVVPDRCGSCTRCIDACPTNALIDPYKMDATRCIAYLTIEHKGTIAEDLMEGMGRQVFGCDICQDVCPWNRKAPVSADPELEARPELVNPALEWLGELDEAAFESNFNGSPVRRVGFVGLRRNVAIAMGNSGQERFTAWLNQWAESADEGLRTAARWALDKLRGRGEPVE